MIFCQKVKLIEGKMTHKTMRAHVITSYRQRPEIRAVAIPTPGPGEILIRVVACGVCHSDIHAIDGDWEPAATIPLIPGHEVTGHVVAHGPGVSSPSLGQAVGVAWLASACGHCEFCLKGMETICPSAEATGYTRDGGYAEYIVTRADFVVAIPENVDLVRIAPILCAGVTTYRGLKNGRAQPGQYVGIVGVGGLGHIAIQYAKAMGFRPVAVDIDQQKLELAKKLGAEFVCNADTGTQAILDVTHGGCHAVLVTATSPRAFEQATEITRSAGTTVFIGIPSTDKDLIKVSIIGLVNGEKSIRGSNVGTRSDLQEAVDFAVRNLVIPQVETVPFEDANNALNRLRTGKVSGRLVLKL
jgi:propanol-preferring alcohol dehydrogenase